MIFSNSKGQITLFIIFGILLISAASFYLYSTEKEKSQKADFSPIESYLKECVESVAEKSIQAVSWQGGLYEFDESKMINAHFGVVAYGYDKGEMTLPSKEKIKDQINSYLAENINSCISDQTIFQGWDVRSSSPSALIDIGEEKIFFKIRYPLTLRREGQSKTFSEFIVDFPLRLGKMHSFAQQVMEEQAQSPGWMPYTKMHSDDQINVTIYLHHHNEFIYEFSDQKSMIDNEPLIFLSAARFSGVESDEVE